MCVKLTRTNWNRLHDVSYSFTRSYLCQNLGIFQISRFKKIILLPNIIQVFMMCLPMNQVNLRLESGN